MPAPTGSNVALASVGAIASASSTYSSAFPVAAVNDGQRIGATWGNMEAAGMMQQSTRNPTGCKSTSME
ncbi:MAG: hypothetical protein ABL869_11895 [Candidatus Nitrotoga sp.]